VSKGPYARFENESSSCKGSYETLGSHRMNNPPHTHRAAQPGTVQKYEGKRQFERPRAVHNPSSHARGGVVPGDRGECRFDWNEVDASTCRERRTIRCGGLKSRPKERQNRLAND